jgi:DNA polymerase-1|tara:strand:- start:5585 stop:6616 length:1032 start_codon:yes stop_codon:yes gene_type:complete
MAESIFDLLNGVKKEDTSDPNSRVLIIDGLNLYLRVFAVNGTLNDKGVPVGGIVGFLKSLAYSIREVNPTRVIIAYDGVGGSQRRRKILPDYKANRKPGKRITRWDAFKDAKEEKESMRIQFSRLLEYMDSLPINVIAIDYIEADDTIAYIANTLLDKEVTIMSADQDFLQLVNERITVWSPIKKKFYTPELVLKDYGVPAHNFLMYKVLMGDKSDNISGVKGLGPKKLPKMVPDIITNKVLDLDSIVQEALKGKEPMHERIVASEHQLEINEKLMDLKNPPVSGELKRQIRSIINEPINLLSRNSFTTMYHDDCMGNALQIPDAWLTQHFVKLNSYAEPTHE